MTKRAIWAGAVLALAVGQARAITIEFDYSLDSNNFFSGANSGRQALLNTAASYYTSFSDSLSVIDPNDGGTWTAMTSLGNINNPTIASGTLRVYVGSADLGSSGPLAYGGPGGYSYSAGPALANAISTRGQSNTSGATTATDFGTWGGSITFNSNILTGYEWNFSMDNPDITEFDFLSVAIHELAHVLGVGVADSWKHYGSELTFTGPTATSVYGSAPGVYQNGHDHLDEGVTSFLPSSGLSQEAAMDPTILNGTRKLPTILDYAVLKDIGWQVPENLLTAVPEPASMAILAVGGVMLLACKKR